MQRRASKTQGGGISRFLVSLLVLLALGVGNAWAVNWASLGTEVVANGEYYIYNVGQNRFLAQKALTDDLSQALCFTIIESTTDRSALGVGKLKALKYGEKKYANRPTSTWPATSATTVFAIKPLGDTYHHHNISGVQNMGSPTTGDDFQLKNFWYGSSTTTIAQATDLPGSNTENYEWVFIPKATFDNYKWYAMAATVEVGQEYYIYNPSQQRLVGFQGALVEKVKDALVFTPEQNATSGLYAYKSNKAYSSTKYYYFKHATAPPTWGSSADYGALYQDNGVYYMAKRQNQMTEPVTYAYKYMYASDASTMTMKSTTQSDWSAVDASCQWLFIPKASMNVLVPLADREEDVVNDWTNASVTAWTSSSSNGFYYLYNPASGCFLGKNGTSADPVVSTDPEQATMFWVSVSSSKYTLCYTDQAAFKYIKNATTAATSTSSTTTSFVLEQTSTNRYHMQCNGTYIYINNGGTNPTFAVGATPNEYSRWVFIPRASYVTLTTPATPPTDKWLAKAVAPEDKGLYYIYNPVSKRFLGKASLQDAETGYPKQFQVNANAGGKFSLAYDEGNGTEVNFVANLKTNWGESEAFFTVAEKSTKSHYYTIATILTNSPYNNRYIAVQKTGATAYTLNIRYNDNNKYKYTNTTVINEDVWNEWLFIPAADFEAEFASAPTAEDIWTAHGAAPEIGKKYFLYNVEAQKFFKWEHLTANTEEALLCTVGEEESGKYISFLANSQTKYVSARAGYGYENSSYILDWEETATDSKQYYIFHNALNEMYGVTIYDFNIHLTANKTYEGYSASAIKNGCRPDALSGKHKWVFVEPVATLYYSASASIHEGQGDIYVYFDTPSLSASTGVESTGSLSASLVKTATFMAMPETGYQFLGWKADPDGDFISTDAMYEHALTVTSTDSEHPDDITLYAFFENKDAEVFDQDGISKGEYAAFADAIAAASKGYTIKLKRNLSGQQTINKGVVIDFNGFTISGTDDNLVTVSTPSTDTVTFMDNTIAAQGGVALAYGEQKATVSNSAIKVTSGTLVISSGKYSAMESYSQAGDGQPYVVNCTGGKVRVNGGYFLASKTGVYNQMTDYVHIFNGNNIQLYGGYYTSNVGNNLSDRVGTDMEVASITGTDPYIFTVQSALDESTVVATANDKKFSSLADAIAYANNNAETTMTIRLAKDCSLPAGNYVIPDKATLLVPYSSLHTEPTIACPLLNNSKLPKQAYRTLTLESGVHIDVYGVIELGGCAYSYGNGAQGTGRPNSDYGQMIMNQGSEIVLNNGANLRAWGFVTGEGTIDARRGARVDEMFQVYDFKGGRGTLAMYENGGHKAFPMNQYFIQNVEVKTTYRPGASLYTTMAAVNTGISVKIIGVDTDGAALFKMDETDDSEDTWVRKWYNPATDQQVYDINNSAAISNLFLPLSAVTGVEGSDFDSKDYILPITNNFKIHVLSGQMDITQDVAFLPGAELEIDKLCTGHIKKNTTTYFYDSEEWGTYVYNGAYASKIKYRPGGLQYNRNISSAAGLGDAKMNIHGTLEVDGGFRTTEHGANIFSTNEDAGTVSYTENSLTTYTDEILDTWTHQVYHPASADNDYKASADAYYIALPAYPAQLQNASGFTSTTTAAVGDNADKSFCYINDAWRLLTNDGCMVTDGEGHYYIKPQEYVELSNNEEDANHLYHNIGNTRDFILTSDRDGNCQWWEVEDVAGHPELKHSIHPENDVYYYYDAEIYGTWLEKRFTIAWRNWDGSLIENYEMKMGAKLQYLGSTPSREKTDYYTYDFAGWNPAIPEDAVVTGDATYTAQFNQTDRKYLITFKNENAMLGALIDESQYLKMGEMPTLPDLGSYASMLTWTPTVSSVTGDANYTLTMANPFATSYTVTFVNWDGSELQSGSVNVGETPVYEGETPIKPSLGDENYTFIGWTPSIAAATADAIYMATFEATHVSGLNISTAQTISDSRVVTDLRVTTTGSLNVTGSITANNFYLESDGSTASGQIIGGEGNITATNIYFDYKINAVNHKWYGVAVPWQVNAANGISVNGRTLTLGKDFDIIYYDGARRAAEGKQKCWKYVENDGDKTLQPGRLYMIGLMLDAPTIRFAKKSGASLLTTSTSVTAYSGAAAVDDQGWNGVANPALFHAYVNPGVTAGQVYNPETNSYDPILMNDAKFVVGQGAFVEVEDDKAITVSYGGTYAAPRRARAEEAPLMDVRIAPAEAEYTDRLFVTVDEEKAETGYVVGKDLAKLGVSKSVAQMWINRYDAQLCLNTVAPVNGVAEYPLSIFAPKAGEYMITINNSQFTMHNADYALYLTQNGRVIWNLSYAPYTATLEKGTTTTYGLRLILQAPQQTTDIDEAIVDAKGETRKVLIDQKVFIIRGNEVYTLDGRLVK